MGYKNLDSLYEEKHRWIRHKNSLDMPENSLNISIWDIYQDIYKMADSLPEQVQCDNYDMRKAMPLETVSVECIRTSNRYLFLKKIESKFRGLTLYNEHIRPWLKQKLSRNFDGGTVDGRKLLAYQGTEFVQVVYRSILGREAEEEALHNANVALRRPGVHRLDILFDICNSQEAKQRQVRIKGISGICLMLKIKRGILRIPFVGYMARWASAVCLLPRRLREMHDRIAVLEAYKLTEERQIELRNNATEAKLGQLMAATENKFCTHLNQISENYTRQEKEILSLREWISAYEQKKLKLKQDKEVLEAEKKAIIDRLYYDYKEKLMMKDFEHYRNDIAPYLTRLNQWCGDRDRSSLRILDMGCGFGEWIAVMQMEGYQPIGVDSNKIMVDIACKEKNLPIIQEDAMEFLRNREEKSLDVIFSFHLIEHLTFIELIDFMRECHRVLDCGGLLVCATPNPENIFIATKEFYMDPTHIKPIPIELLAFYFEEFGFEVIDRVKINARNEFVCDYKQDDPLSIIAFRFNMEEESCVWGVKK